MIPRITPESPLETPYFLIRDLMESDASAVWLSWFKDKLATSFILSDVGTWDTSHLRSYIRDRSGLDTARFFGVFEISSGKHIGNIKYEPINLEGSYAVMGVLIGEERYRGRGFFREIYKCTVDYLVAMYTIRRVFLGVDKRNTMAIRAYKKVGFLETRDHPFKVACDKIFMVDSLESLSTSQHLNRQSFIQCHVKARVK